MASQLIPRERLQLYSLGVGILNPLAKLQEFFYQIDVLHEMRSVKL
jgi:hypothetical protein